MWLDMSNLKWVCNVFFVQLACGRLAFIGDLMSGDLGVHGLESTSVFAGINIDLPFWHFNNFIFDKFAT